jgi:hypothetical protein
MVATAEAAAAATAAAAAGGATRDLPHLLTIKYNDGDGDGDGDGGGGGALLSTFDAKFPSVAAAAAESLLRRCR